MRIIKTPLVKEHQRYALLFALALVAGAVAAMAAPTALFYWATANEVAAVPVWYYGAVAVVFALIAGAALFTRKMVKTEKSIAGEIERAVLADLGMTALHPHELHNLGTDWTKAVMLDHNGDICVWLFKKDITAGTVLARQLTTEEALLI